jgi:hypothetical protein
MLKKPFGRKLPFRSDSEDSTATLTRLSLASSTGSAHAQKKEVIHEVDKEVETLRTRGGIDDFGQYNNLL